jgi:hypothetical protein
MKIYKIIYIFVFQFLLNCYLDNRVSNQSTIDAKVLINLLANETSLLSNLQTNSSSSDKKVFANLEWQDIGVELKELKTIVLSATGFWYMTATPAIPPEGSATNPALFSIDYRVNKNFLHGQLICRNTNSINENFSIGNYTPSVNGRMECRINDTAINNNSGSLKIFVNF